MTPSGVVSLRDKHCALIGLSKTIMSVMQPALQNVETNLKDFCTGCILAEPLAELPAASGESSERQRVPCWETRCDSSAAFLRPEINALSIPSPTPPPSLYSLLSVS